MGGNVMKSDLSPARRRLIELMQRVNFGRLEGLQVRGGEPAFDPPPRVVREVKLGGEDGPRRGPVDFALKAQVVELFALMDGTPDTTIEVLEVKHGLPFRVFAELALR